MKYGIVDLPNHKNAIGEDVLMRGPDGRIYLVEIMENNQGRVLLAASKPYSLAVRFCDWLHRAKVAIFG